MNFAYILYAASDRVATITLNRPKQLNALNEELLIRLHEGGLVAPSYTTLAGSYCLRAAIVNHRTRTEDLGVLVDEVLRVGRGLRGG